MTRSPAWYVVTFTGTMACLLTALMFSSLVSSNDPTIGQIAQQSRLLAPVTRETMEEAGDWSAQDKWRLAHLFVEHRPPRRMKDPRIDSSLVNDFSPFVAPELASLKRRDARSAAPSELILPDHEVRLELGVPRVAEEPKRLVYGPYVREPGADFHSVRPVANYRSRDTRLLVQAEWSFASDCEPVRGPVRRVIPVPEPQWDELPPVTDDRRPDLSFQMSMLREFLPAGEFPARSRFESVEARSEFPESFNPKGPFDQFARDDSPWRRSRLMDDPQRPVESYADRVARGGVVIPDEIPDSDLRQLTAPSFAEVALRLEILGPESAIAGQLNQSSLVVYNEGLREIPLLKVQESLAGLSTVTDAVPPAGVNAIDNMLNRQVQHLEPGKKEKLDLVWRPNAEGKRVHSAVVTANAFVGATTEVVRPVVEQPMPSVAPEPIPEREPAPEPEFESIPLKQPENPSLSFDVQNQPRATVDDLVEIAIVVRNTGDTPLHHVRVVARLPEHLKHRKGTEVEFTIDSLPVRATQNAVLRVVADSPGQAICHFQATADEPTDANSRAIVDIVAKPERIETPRVQPANVTKAEPPKPKSPPVKRPPAPAPANCCCQSQPILIEPGQWFVP